MSVVPAEARVSSRLQRAGIAVALVAAVVLAVLVVGPARDGAERAAVAQSSAPPSSGSPANVETRAAVPAGVRRLRLAHAKLPLSFVPNAGQIDRRVHYYAEGPGYGFYFTPGEAVLSLVRGQRGVALGLRFLGSSPWARIEGRRRRAGRVNYLLGNDPSRWHTGLPTYGRVVYRDLWPGVELAFRGGAARFEYELVLRPRAHLKRIRLAYRGAEGLALDRARNLLIRTPLGVLRDEAPRSYQVIGGRRVPVESAFTLRRAGRLQVVGFALGRHKTGYPIVIDPGLVYSTYLGGAGFDAGRGIAVDAAENAYVTGQTGSSSFPTTVGAFSRTNNAGDAFVTKLDPSGFLVYSTFLGGGGGEAPTAVAVDGAGNAYVTGLTSSTNFPSTAGAPRSTYGGGFDDAFVTKLNATGSALVFSTYLGGAATDLGAGIAVDSAGSAYVTGSTNSTNFPTTAGALDTSFGGGVGDDAFVTKLSATGTGLAYSTYLGGAGGDDGAGISVDSPGSAYVTGSTGSDDFPTTASALSTTRHTFGRDAFVTKLNASGSALLYSTYLGGSGQEGGVNGALTPELALAVDAAGSAYVIGATNSTDFPTTAGALSTRLGGTSDYVVTKLNASGSALVYSTYLGGSGGEPGETTTAVHPSIALDSAGRAYVTGSTHSTDFPTTPDALKTSFAGGLTDFSNAFVTILDATGSSIFYSTFLGGSAKDAGAGIAVGADRNAYVTGHTSSADFPSTLSAQPAFGGGTHDAFVTVIGPPSRLSVSGVFPNKGGDTGKISVVIHGRALETGATATLRRAGEPDIVGDTGVAPVDQLTLPATFDLTGAARGSWDVVVTNPDGTFVTLHDGLTVEAGTGADVWVDVIGPSTATLGRPRTFNVVAGNNGDVDASGVPLQLTFPNSLGWGFDPFSPPVFEEGPARDIDLPIVIPDIPPGDVVTFPIRLTPDPALLNQRLDFGVTSRPCDPLPATTPVRSIHSASDAQAFIRSSTPDGRPSLTLQLAYLSQETYGNLYAENVIRNLGYQLVSQKDAGELHIEAWRAPDGNIVVAFRGTVPTDLTNLVADAGFGGSAPIGASLNNEPGFLQLRDYVRASVDFINSLPLQSNQRMIFTGHSLGGGLAQLFGHATGFDAITFNAPGIGWVTNELGDVLKPLSYVNPRRSDTSNLLNVIQQGEPIHYLPPRAQLGHRVVFENDGTHTSGSLYYHYIASVLQQLNRDARMVKGGYSPPDCFVSAIQARRRLVIVVSRDPNGKVGSDGVGGQHFLSGAKPLRYNVFFENTETAAAPAQEVVVTDRLDPSNVDLSSLSLGPMSFGDHIVAPPPGVSDFTTDVDLRPAKNLIVRVSANLDTTTDVLTWRFRSLDPTTMRAPDDPLVGFLPPNTSPPDGEGSVFFTVMPKAGLGTGTEIRNKATIVFDQNAPIDTQEWLNTLDNSKPSSSVAALPAAETSPSFDVSWSGTDSGSGIQDYTVFVSEDGGPFNAWQVDTASTSATFTGQPRKRYAFYSVGRDATGNVEDAPVRADATTIVAAGDTTPPVISCASSDGLWHSANVSIACTARDDGSGLANPADANFSLSTQVPSGSETSNAQTERREVCDNAGNCASAGPIGGNMVDRKGPSITLTAPPANGSGDYLFKAPVPASYSCSDGGSGMSGGSASCTGTVPNGSNIATSSVGAQPFAVDATDAVGNPARVTTTYNVHATTSLAYNGQQIVSANSTLLVGAKLSSAASSCSSGRTIAFFLDGDPDGAGPMTAVLGVVTTDSSGQATLALQTTNWTVGAVYTVTASYAGAAACLASSDSTGTLIVSSPGDSADGGGWYTVAGSGRSNFGFVVNKVPNTTTYKGQILFMNTGKWRLKGDLNGYSKSGSSASLAGTGNLYYWDQTLNGGLGDWLLSQWGVAFAISYTDVGTATKTSSDTFGIIINHLVLSPPEPSTLPSSKPQALKGGNITIR